MVLNFDIFWRLALWRREGVAVGKRSLFKAFLRGSHPFLMPLLRDSHPFLRPFLRGSYPFLRPLYFKKYSLESLSITTKTIKQKQPWLMVETESQDPWGPKWVQQGDRGHALERTGSVADLKLASHLSLPPFFFQELGPAVCDTAIAGSQQTCSFYVSIIYANWIVAGTHLCSHRSFGLFVAN